MFDQIQELEVDYQPYFVEKIEKSKDDNFIISTTGESIITKSIFIATGTSERKLGVPGEEEYYGKGISYCAVCDAALYKNKEMIVVGGVLLQGGKAQGLGGTLTGTSDSNLFQNSKETDVSHYVKEGTAIDSDALTRGTSVYIPGSVVPMLPHELSDDLCSLNPNTKKLTMTAEIIVDENGKMESYKIYKSFIYSHHRLNYDEVNELFEGNIQELYTPELTKMLNVARELYEKVRIDKEKNGMISFEAAESKVILDQTGRTIDVVNRVRKDAEKMIEQFMVLANEATATFLSKSKFNSIYRIHDEPSAKKIKNYNQIIEIIGENKKERNHIPQKDITLLCDKIHNRPNYNIFANLILRCMEKARYDIQNIGHYGLSSKNYTHFTSPIRRYPDLIVHRLLKYALTKKETGIFANDRDLMLSICEQCNKTETRAMECE
uniref:RNB domain-containing protein n=1 Tax=Biomphalaria glabrata TaxID=6526 RepID=A0A2C9JR40_BIOGL